MGSFNYDVNKMIFRDEFIADEKQIRSVLDYFIEINPLSEKHQRYEALTGTYTVVGTSDLKLNRPKIISPFGDRPQILKERSLSLLSQVWGLT